LTLPAAAAPALVPDRFGLGTSPPDLFTALAVFLAMRADGHRAVPWAILLGVAKDATSLDPLGSSAFALGTVAFLLARPRTVPATVGAARAAAVAGATLLAHVVYVLRMIPVAREG